LPGLRDAELSRRALLKGLLAAGLTAPSLSAVLAACGGDDGSSTAAGGGATIPAPDNPVRWPLSEKNPAIESGLTPEPGSTLRLYNYADYMGPQVLKDFERQFDVQVRVSTFNDGDEALTKVASGDLGFDIYFPSYDSLGRLVQADLLRPLNQDYVPNAKNLWPEFLDPWYDQGWQYSVPYTVYTTGIGWRTDMVDEDVAARENPYDVFWDPQYFRDIAVLDDWHTTMGMVLLRNGIYDINTTDPDDIALMRADLLDMYDKTRPQVEISQYNDMPAGQYGVCQLWSGDIVNAQYYLPRGVSSDILRYWFPSDGRGQVDNDLMVVLAQGENPVAAHHFINYMLDAKVAAKNFGWTGYQPPQKALTPESLVRDGYLPPNLESAAVLQSYFTDGVRLLQLPPEADTQYHQIWQEFKAGG
jgi:spermidine/putrescine transport system substrate-binding protein